MAGTSDLLAGIPSFLGKPRPVALFASPAPAFGSFLSKLLKPRPAGPVRVQSFAMVGQEQTNWCWAAVTQAVVNSINPSRVRSQAEVATDHIVNSGRTIVCEGNIASMTEVRTCGPVPSCRGSCNDQHIIKYILAEYGLAVKTIGEKGVAPSFRDIQRQVNKNRPVVVAINYPTGRGWRGHFVAITGWEVDAVGSRQLFIHDPALATAASPIRERMLAYEAFANRRYHLSGRNGVAAFSYQIG